MRILLVEDNALNSDMLSRRLTRRGLEVTCAFDGSEGVRLAREERPDVILMDISLPVLDGWQAIGLLKASLDTEPIPIIALTAHAMVQDHDRAMALGCVDFVSKPIDMAHLLGAIALQVPPGDRR